MVFGWGVGRGVWGWEACAWGEGKCRECEWREWGRRECECVGAVVGEVFKGTDGWKWTGREGRIGVWEGVEGVCEGDGGGWG